MNAGARHCTGDVLWFVHADTELDPAALAQIRTTMSDPKVVGGGLTLRFDRRGPGLDYLAHASNVRARRLKHVFGDQAMFVRRSVFDQRPIRRGAAPALAAKVPAHEGRPAAASRPVTADARRRSAKSSHPAPARNRPLPSLHQSGEL